MDAQDTRLKPDARRMLDAYLVLAAQAGDERAFADLIKRWQRRLTAHAMRLIGDREIALDAVQGAWMEIARGIHGLKDEAAFPAWAYRVVSRRCSREIKDLRRRRDIVSAAAADVGPDAAWPDPVADDQTRRLRAAMRDLPPGQRAALALYHFEDLSVAEIAVALDVPVGTVKTRLMHARRTLRTALGDDHDQTSHPHR